MKNRLSLINPWRGPCPPDGFRWKDPLDGWESHAWDYGTWVEQAVRHYHVNKREVPPDLGEQMQEQLCLRLPPGWCNYDNPNRERAAVSLEWNDVLAALQVFKEWIKAGCSFVTQSEAERRALICSRCYMNTFIGGCSACQKMVAEVTGKRATKYDFALNSCGVCKCVLKAKVHFPQNILDKEALGKQEVYPEHCWLKRGGPNHQP